MSNPTVELYVVVSTKKFPSGSRVGCMACPKEEAEATQKRLEESKVTKDFGPFKVITYKEAEKKRLYGC